MDQILVNFENLRVKHAGGTRLWTGGKNKSSQSIRVIIEFHHHPHVEQIELITCTGCTQEETRSALVEVVRMSLLLFLAFLSGESVFNPPSSAPTEPTSQVERSFDRSCCMFNARHPLVFSFDGYWQR